MTTIFKNSAWALALTLICFASCKKNNNTPTTPVSPYYDQADQMGRPAINTVFNAPADKDAFNAITPSAMGAVFQPKFLTNLVALDNSLFSRSPTGYTKYSANALGWSATTLTTNLASDVLNVSTKGATTLATLSGRALGDDAIDIELKYVIFGGPAGTSNTQLTSDHVNANDVAFLPSFPYLASPHK